MKTHRVMRRYSKPQPAFLTVGTLRKIDTKRTRPPTTHFSAQFFSPSSRCGIRDAGRCTAKTNISQQISTLIAWGERDAPVRRLSRTQDEQDEQLKRIGSDNCGERRNNPGFRSLN
jgi:hypothetical protein